MNADKEVKSEKQKKMISAYLRKSAAKPFFAATGTAFFLGRRLACRIFLRRRSDLGVTSTSSSSAMNSRLCSRLRVRKGIRRIAFIGGGGAHVGQLLFAHGVDVEIVVARVLADDHAFVDLHAGADEEFAALLQAIEGVGGGASRCDPR